MSIEFNCESCSKLLRVPDGSGGKQCLCPGCSKVLDIPLPKVDAPTNVPSQNDGMGPNDGVDIALCIPCPKCKHELICDPSLVGTKGQCRSCKHIFVISDSPTSEASLSEPAVNRVFSCPKCAQLFEGSEAMRGKRGKCHVCGEVFSIVLRNADDSPEKSPNEKPSPEPAEPSNRITGFYNGELILDGPPEETSSKPEPTSKPQKPSTSSGTVVSKVSRSDSQPIQPIQFNCSSCKGRMEVPGEGAQQLTHCPHCKRQLTVPSESEPTLEALAANDPWANLSPLGAAPAPIQESSPFGDTLYPPPMPMSPMDLVARRRGTDPVQHIVCGIFISLFALIAIVVEIFQIVINTIVLIAAGNTNPTMSAATIWILLIWILLLILSIMQLVGGIALARRVGISTARAGAIICCLPCFCLINIAFGIWGCILVFGNKSERDFR